MQLISTFRACCNPLCPAGGRIEFCYHHFVASLLEWSWISRTTFKLFSDWTGTSQWVMLIMWCSTETTEEDWYWRSGWQRVCCWVSWLHFVDPGGGEGSGGQVFSTVNVTQRQDDQDRGSSGSVLAPAWWVRGTTSLSWHQICLQVFSACLRMLQ